MRNDKIKLSNQGSNNLIAYKHRVVD